MTTIDTRGNVHDDDGRFAEKQNSAPAALASARPTPALPAEVNRRLRGHSFYPPKSARVPGIRETEGVPLEEKTVALKYFGPAGDWWITELDRETGEAFGYARLASAPEYAEWGYISLPELERIRIGSFVAVERDLNYEPQRVAEAIPRR